MPGSDGLGFFVILNKSSELSFGLRRSELIFGPRWSQSSYGLGGAPRIVGSDGTVSIVKIVSLSLSACQIPKSQEGNKSFVPEPRESSVFSVFRIPMRMNIIWTLWTFLRIRIFHILRYGYVTYIYIYIYIYTYIVIISYLLHISMHLIRLTQRNSHSFVLNFTHHLPHR